MRTYVFGYGSLLHRGSLARGLQRPVGDDDLHPALLGGFRRVWGASEQVICAGRPGVTCARFLDLVAEEGALVNGAAIPVTAVELESLVVREKAYVLHEVTGRVEGLPTSGRCFTFASAPGAVHPGDVVLAEYVRLVEEGFGAVGPGQLAAFRRLTAPAGLPVVEGMYRFVDPEQNARTSRAEDRVA